jgi:hypothetical protein
MIDSSSATKAKAGYGWVIGVGIGTLVNAIFNCFIICSHPGFQKANQHPSVAQGPGGGAGDGGVAGSDPSKMTDAQIRAYLEAHPEIAQQALAGISAAPVQNGAGGKQPAPRMAPQQQQQDWTGAAAPAAAASASTGKAKTGGLFGKKNTAAAPAPAPAPAPAAFTGAVEHTAVPVSQGYKAPAATRAAAPVAPARSAQAEEEANPFANASNPFAV